MATLGADVQFPPILLISSILGLAFLVLRGADAPITSLAVSEQGDGQVTLTAYPDPAFNAVGTARSQIVGVAVEGSGPVPGVMIHVDVTGANVASGDCTTSSGGVCEVIYVGQNLGVDTITASAEVNGTPVQDQITTEWVDSPANDQFSAAKQISSLPFSDSVVTVAASTEPGEPSGCGSMDKTVWYRLNVTERTTVAASTDTSNFHTSLAIYQGNSLGGLSLIDCDQFDPGPPPPPLSVSAADTSLSGVSVAAELQPGISYYLQAGGYQEASGELHIEVFSTGVVTGRLFLDVNLNGHFDEGDEGIVEHTVTLESGEGLRETRTAGGGFFQFVVPADDYLLEADPGFPGTLCIDGAPPFNPTSLDGCISPSFPRFFTTPNPQGVSVTASESTVADIVVRRGDAMVLTGIALLGDDMAPAGVEVRAVYEGNECASSAIIKSDSHRPNYEIMVLGAGERAGCPQPGEAITIEVGGVEADSLAYNATEDSFLVRPLMALGDRAWYWAQQVLLPNAPAPTGKIEAWVGGTLCGEATLATQSTFFGQRVSGLSALVVESNSLRPGCGAPGATVSFQLNGAQVGTTSWEAGLTYVRLNLPGAIVVGDLDCSTIVDAVDALLVLRLVAKLTTHTPCSPFASDANCDLALNAVDALAILRWIAQLPVDQPKGCPQIGTAG